MRPGWLTQRRTCGARAGSQHLMIQGTTGGSRCSHLVKAGTTIIMLTRLPRAMDLPGTKSTSTGGEFALCSFWGSPERSNWLVWLGGFSNDGRRWGPKRRTGNISMNNKGDTSSIILVVEDVNETRDGIEKLLKADGYRVTLARDERDAIESV